MKGEHVTADNLDRPGLNTWGDDPQAVVDAAIRTWPLLQSLGEKQAGQIGVLIQQLAAGSDLARVLMDVVSAVLSETARPEAAKTDHPATWRA